MRSPANRTILAISLSTAVLSGAGNAVLGVCGPFTDVAADAFCPFVLEVFYVGITTGTTPTTYDPAGPVSRLQMAAFLSRTVDGLLHRSSRRTILNQNWTQRNALNVQSFKNNPGILQSDGADIWAAITGDNKVERYQGITGKLLETWTDATAATGVCVVNGYVFVTGKTSPGKLYFVPSFSTFGGGTVTTIATNLGVNPTSIAYDGTRLFTANSGAPGSLSMVTLAGPFPPVTTVTAGFTSPRGLVYDGANMWVTDTNLMKLDSNGGVLQTVTVGSVPFLPLYDGTNIWVPNAASNSISIVRPATGVVVATLTGNGLSFPTSVAFDGERMLVTNAGGDSISLWKAAGLSPAGVVTYGAGTSPFAACSDGLSFWMSFNGSGQIVQF